MNYAAIYEADCANGPGMRTSLFVSGCTHHCKGCFNEEAWDFSYGKPYTDETEEYIVSTLDNPQVDGLSILGGEPMEPENQHHVLELAWRVKAMGKTVWLYSGYTWEQLTSEGGHRCCCSATLSILSAVDVLVDGEFHQEEKDISLRFRGSRNQRLIDVQKSLMEGRVVLWG